MATNEVGRILIDLADKDLTRLHSALMREQRAKAVQYLATSLLMLSACFAARNILTDIGFLSGALLTLSAALFAAVVFLATYVMSGGNFRSGALSNYVGWLQSVKDEETEESFYADVLRMYERAIKDAENVIKARGTMLRIMNGMTLVAFVLFACGASWAIV